MVCSRLVRQIFKELSFQLKTDINFYEACGALEGVNCF